MVEQAEALENKNKNRYAMAESVNERQQREIVSSPGNNPNPVLVPRDQGT